MRHILEGEKAHIRKWLPLATEMKLAGTSDHSQYVFVVSSMSECGPCVYLWLWKWSVVTETWANPSVDNQTQIDHIFHWKNKHQQQTNKTATHWMSNMVATTCSPPTASDGAQCQILTLCPLVSHTLQASWSIKEVLQHLLCHCTRCQVVTCSVQ